MNGISYTGTLPLNLITTCYNYIERESIASRNMRSESKHDLTYKKLEIFVTKPNYQKHKSKPKSNEIDFKGKCFLYKGKIYYVNIILK